MSYKLRNEEYLVNYLWSQQFPIDIIEVYKKILLMSFKDINQYPLFSLKISIYNEKELKEEINDMIETQNGKLTTFVITKNGKTIKLNDNAEWEYLTTYDDISVSLNASENSYTYKLITNRKSNSDILISKIKNDADKDISYTKKLIKNTFNNK